MVQTSVVESSYKRRSGMETTMILNINKRATSIHLCTTFPTRYSKQTKQRKDSGETYPSVITTSLTLLLFLARRFYLLRLGGFRLGFRL